MVCIQSKVYLCYLFSGGMSFNPEAFLRSLRRDVPSDPDYLTQTFEDYLKKKDLWETYKTRIGTRFEKYDEEVSRHRNEYNSEMARRRSEKQDPAELKTFHKMFEKEKEREEDPEAKRLAHISEFGH